MIDPVHCTRISALNQNKFACQKARQGKAFLSQFLVCIYRLKFYAFSDIDNLKLLFVDIDNFSNGDLMAFVNFLPI